MTIVVMAAIGEGEEEGVVVNIMIAIAVVVRVVDVVVFKSIKP